MNKNIIQRLRQLSQSDLQEVYKNVFESDGGQLILEDLKARFFEYVPVSDMNQAGAQAVLIHIKNMIEPMPEMEDARS